MPNMNNFMRYAGYAADWSDTYERKAGIQFMIDHQTTSVVLVRSGVAQAAQAVRLAYETTRSDEIVGEAGVSGRNILTLIGMPDFDVRRGDRFMIGTARYEVTFVDSSLPGKIEARTAAVQ